MFQPTLTQTKCPPLFLVSVFCSTPYCPVHLSESMYRIPTDNWWHRTLFTTVSSFELLNPLLTTPTLIHSLGFIKLLAKLITTLFWFLTPVNPSLIKQQVATKINKTQPSCERIKNAISIVEISQTNMFCIVRINKIFECLNKHMLYCFVISTT